MYHHPPRAVALHHWGLAIAWEIHRLILGVGSCLSHSVQGLLLHPRHRGHTRRLHCHHPDRRLIVGIPKHGSRLALLVLLQRGIHRLLVGLKIPCSRHDHRGRQAQQHHGEKHRSPQQHGAGASSSHHKNVHTGAAIGRRPQNEHPPIHVEPGQHRWGVEQRCTLQYSRQAHRQQTNQHTLSGSLAVRRLPPVGHHHVQYPQGNQHPAGAQHGTAA
mmetsp:Transcript_49427/g.107928  ORF Transcript_49427/g.107928 Transcript_49427/m.107928 type:complete len:216 (-) Transcript_49427:317-964(-)